jgi:hypothetical protein
MNHPQTASALPPPESPTLVERLETNVSCLTAGAWAFHALTSHRLPWSAWSGWPICPIGESGREPHLPTMSE